MSHEINSKDGYIFMKVGVHASEPFDKILERKTKEYEKTGKMFWGYGGGTCHPINQVQPYAKVKKEEGSNIYILMNEIESHHISTQVASEFSRDGIYWEPIPDGIMVTGSRYALVLDELKPGDLDLNLSDTNVAIGTSRGKNGSNYVRGRVDKACLDYSPANALSDSADVKKISHIARLQEPFAVILR